MELRKAERKKAKLKIGIASPTGCGKTYSSLLLAHGLVGSWDKIAVIDTENGSAELYDHFGPYNVITLIPPFIPENYIKAIDMCDKAGMECIIVDSASHEWSGTGGSLDIHAQLGGKFTDWAKVIPRHRAFFDKILQTPRHFIVTSRTKTDWDIVKNDRGKSEPVKVGLKAEQREGIEYEWTVAFRLTHNNLVVVEKDRTGLFTGQPEFKITSETGILLKDWAEKGIEAPKKDEKKPSIYDGSTDQQKKIQDILVKMNVGEEKWGDIHEKMMGKPSTDLQKIIKEVTGA